MICQRQINLLSSSEAFEVEQDGDGLGQNQLKVRDEAGELLGGKRAAIQFYYNRKYGKFETAETAEMETL